MPYLGFLIAAGLLYDGGVFYSRWNSNRQAAKAEAEKQTEQARNVVKELGGEGLKILSFYAAPGKIARGGHTNLCYGVSGAKTVRIEPPVDAVWPALTRCVQVAPRKDTGYKLIAEDGSGHSASEMATVNVR
ncbi:MAG TPA: hypothetical protein VHZ74_03710 [Bryobacteraceae bacterium]|jgi:hypothetical protein|nr:hypothetical protein [Bryobacteraceae bacterium]